MTQPAPNTGLSFAQKQKVHLRLALAWLAIACEQLGDRLWSAIAVLAVGAALALTDVLPSLPPTVHLIVLLVFGAGLGAMTMRALRGFRWPTRNEARARVEAAATITHRPLTASEDTLA